MRLLVVPVLLVFGFPVTMNELVDSFKTCSEFFLDKKPPVIPGVLKDSVSQNNNRYKLICQRYKNVYRFATLYDKDKKIPVFSAYRYTGHHKEKRPDVPWMIEPKLEDLGDDMRVPCVNQAHNGDYVNKIKLDRGHLFPSSHAADKDTSESTFTLTNAVPQHNSFNTGSWNRMEQRVRGIMNSQCHNKDKPKEILAYVLTGAVASEENLNEKVNIPTHMWSVFCCYDSTAKKWESQAHWAENKAGSADIATITLGNLQEFLQTKYGTGSTLFNSGCLESLNAAGDQLVASEPEDEAESKSWWDFITSVPKQFNRLYMWVCG